jgi:predicted Zn-dependent protease
MPARLNRTAVAVFALAVAAASARAQGPQPSPVLTAMRDELARSLQALRAQPTQPYFLSYDITEDHSITLAGSFGAITENRERRHRALDLDLRVGDPAFDNTHRARGAFPGMGDLAEFFDRQVDMPIDDDPGAIRAALWYQTDRQYRHAVERLTWLKTNALVSVQPEDQSPDFSPGPAERYAEPPLPLAVDRRVWEEKIRKYTAPFARQGDIYAARASFSADVATRWYVNSEGTEITTSQPIYRLVISAYAKANDGMELPRYESFYTATPDGFPDDRVVLERVKRMIADLHALRRAPIVDPYTGPAILSGRASAVFFHEVFGHRVEGHRQKDEWEGQTFKDKVNQSILPEAFSIFFDPTLKQLGRTELAGFYRYDDEGVKARRVPVVEHGVFKNFLMSRSPIAGFAQSNGHGRKQIGFRPVARQSNLIVQVTAPHPRAELKQMLRDEIKRVNKPFGLLFDDIEGGFTVTQRVIPNSFNVLPVMVYRVYPDGREELVRGVDFIGTPLTAISRIAAADDEVAVFNGLCGAESGWVPVSAVSPAVFLTQVEIQKKLKSQDRPPILPPPFDTTRALGARAAANAP